LRDYGLTQNLAAMWRNFQAGDWKFPELPPRAGDPGLGCCFGGLLDRFGIVGIVRDIVPLSRWRRNYES